MQKNYLIPHTHWDKEWYFSTKDAMVLLDQVLKDAINSMEKDESLTFSLDGQSSLVQEFLEINPEYKEKITKLIGKGQLEIGPWYTQTDCLNVDGENIIRNLVYGIYISKKLGNYMKIAYLPDTFGFNSQMPLLVNHVGIENLIFRRGGSYGEGKLVDPLFLWKTKDNSTLKTVHIIKGYDLGAKFSDNKDYIENNLSNSLKKISDLTKSKLILCPTGNDQLNLNPNLSELVKNVNEYSDDEFIISTYSQYFEDTKDYFNKEYVGDLRYPEYDRVHLTIGTVRTDIKLTNWNLEQKLFKKIEPLIVLAREFDIWISVPLLYKAWERIFDSAAHDAMGGCVTDPVHEDIMQRYKEANEILDGIENTIVNKLSQKLGLCENEIIIFNLAPKDFSGTKKIEYFSNTKNAFIKEAKSTSIIDVVTYSAKENPLINNDDIYYLIKAHVQVEIPAFGFKVFTLVENENVEENILPKVNIGSLKFYEQNKKLVCEKDGVIINDFLSFIDIGNDGDTYDFSPLKDDIIVNSELINWEFKSLNRTNKINLTYELLLPYSLEDRVTKTNIIKQQVNVTLLIFDESYTKVSVKFDNKVLSHRLSIVFNTGNKINDFIKSTPFGIDCLTCEDKREKIDGDYIEYNVNNFNFDEFVNVKVGNETFITIVSHGSKELYFENEKIIVPLISTTGEFGKSDLLYRPGRASGDTSKKGHIVLFTPRAQLLGENNFDFDLYFTNTQLNGNQLQSINENIGHDTFYQWQFHNKFHYRLDNKIQVTDEKCLELKEYSSFSINGNVQIKTITPSLYDENSFLIRLYNPFDKDEKFNFVEIFDYEIVNAIEERMKNQELVVKAFSITTVKVRRRYEK